MLNQKKAIEDITNRLKTFGISYNSLEDKWMIDFLGQKIINHIKSECNISCIPLELYEKIINQICGEFLYEKRSSGKLDLENINLDSIVSSIKEGDTQVNFATDDLSDSQRLDVLINMLKDSITESDYASFRRFKW